MGISPLKITQIVGEKKQTNTNLATSQAIRQFEGINIVVMCLVQCKQIHPSSQHFDTIKGYQMTISIKLFMMTNCCQDKIHSEDQLEDEYPKTGIIETIVSIIQ